MKRFLIVISSLILSLCINAQSEFNMGCAVNPEGESWTLDSKSLMFNNKRIIPVMGEIHFARVPENRWRTELLRMKAGGVTVVATYAFWIHHEEIEGKFDWSGNRNLHKFLSICKDLDMPVILRVGPFCHGECRNGGFPEWLIQQKYKIRTNDASYLAKVDIWFSQLFSQVNGLMWKQGGTVIGMQIENEYRGRWEHLQTLKDMARHIGFDLPIYTRTGWPKLATPAKYGELIPLYGDYCDGFWDRALTDMPGSYTDCYLFRSYRGSTVIATEQIKNQNKADSKGEAAYPFLTCELGGGMETSYHRRVFISPMDIYSVALVKVGNGSNLPGYYMYHGGTNPQGKLTAMNEQQRTLTTNYNDLPVKNYDFQAPIGEFGQLNGQYHLLRGLHLFLKEFGDKLSVMEPSFPITETSQKRDSNQLRWNYRTDGKSGFVFVNNYQRLKNMTEKKNVSFDIRLSDGKVMHFPSSNVTVPSNTCFFMPFNMQLGKSTLRYATAQPITKVGNTYFFKQIKGIASEFAFDKSVKINSCQGSKEQKSGTVIIRNVKSGRDAAIVLDNDIRVILLSDEDAYDCWKTTIAGKEHIIIAKGSVMTDKDTLSIEDNAKDFRFAVYPAFSSVTFGGKEVRARKLGLFDCYEVASDNDVAADAVLSKVKDAGALRTITIGAGNAAEEPVDSDFANAAQWNIDLSNVVGKAGRRPLLSIEYKGDVARLYDGSTLIDDNFYNGREFLCDLSCLEKNPKTLRLDILPYQTDAPIYIQEPFRFEGGIKDVNAKITYLNTATFVLK